MQRFISVRSWFRGAVHAMWIVCSLGPLASAAPAQPGDEAPWPAPVAGFVPPQAGEHPRLLFRKTDLLELRKRAQTPEGQAILKRLRVLLNGGDGQSMPTLFNASGKAYAGNKAGAADDADTKDAKNPSVKNPGKNEELPAGAYTIGHAAGFGLLYQLTGEKKYADLGRKCFEKAFEGVRDRDDRYSFRVPGGALRCGPSIGAYAIGFDLCCEGWDADFRRKVTEAFINYDEGPNMSLASCALGKRQNPGSNHWGAEIGGPATVLLAIRGEAGADDKKVDELLEGNAKCFIRLLTEGWGDRGFFAEGDGPGTISSDTSFIPALQAWRVAGGKDFITPRPNAQWMTLKWVMGTICDGAGDGKWSFPMRGTYGHNVYSRTGMSGSGTFAQGFGAISEESKPALLWLYNHAFSASDAKADSPFDTINLYPHRAVLSFINWPLAMREKNPSEILPRAVEDKKFGFYMFRNRWKDADDIVVTALLKGSKGNYSVPGGEIMVYGLGKKTTFPIKLAGNSTFFKATASGGVFATSAGSFGVDFSGASGAEALLVLSGPVQGAGRSKGDVQVVAAGKNNFTIMTLGKGPSPQAKADGERLVIGQQTISVEPQGIVFGK